MAQTLEEIREKNREYARKYYQRMKKAKAQEKSRGLTVTNARPSSLEKRVQAVESKMEKLAKIFK